MDRTQRSKQQADEATQADTRVARSQADHGPTQRHAAPTSVPGPAEAAGAWEASDGLMSAMGLADGAVQRDAATAGPSDEAVGAAAKEGASGGGSSIPHKEQMESAFGTSFDHVQAHMGSQATQACNDMGANAYATGNNVVFGDSSPSPGLVAHELTHVVQQSGGMRPSMKVGQVGDSYEQEADSVASRVSAGESVADVTQRHLGGGGGGGGAVQQSAVQRSNDAEGEGGDGHAAGGGGGAGGGGPAREANSNATGAPGAAAAGGGGAGGAGAAGAGGNGALIPGYKGAVGDDQMTEDARKPDTVVVQRDSAQNVTPWGSTYIKVGVDAPPRALIGNVNPSGRGAYQFNYTYEGRWAYKGDTWGKFETPDGAINFSRADMDSGRFLKYDKRIRTTAPGEWTAKIGNSGGTFADALEAQESFTVVNPFTDVRRVSSRDIWDFDNPIPLQMVGTSAMEFQLAREHVRNRRIAASATGSSSNTVSDKITFGARVGLDNDEGSEGEGKIGFSTETSHAVAQEWSREQYHQQETKLGRYEKYTFQPDPGERGRSKMLIPIYEWVEWTAKAYPHDPATLLTTGAQRTVTIGMLRPTGEVREQRSTDPGVHSNSRPTENAQTDPDVSDAEIANSHADTVRAASGWRTINGATYDTGAQQTVQFIQGPISMQPAGRDYRAQKGVKVHPGTSNETFEAGGSATMSLEDGMTASSSETDSAVTTNQESWSIEANPGIKGLGQIGDSLGREQSTAVANAAGAGVSSSASDRTETSISISHKVAKKPRQNQYVIFTPLVNHKVYKIGYGARRPSGGGNAVEGRDFQVAYVHIYKHSPLPHIHLQDIGRDETPPRGSVDWPRFTAM